VSTCTQAEHCENQFESIHLKLDRLDEAIRGNGKPGLQLRLDRLEQDARRQRRLIWVVVGAVTAAAASAAVAWLTAEGVV
jgi:hypothetical protein